MTVITQCFIEQMIEEKDPILILKYIRERFCTGHHSALSGVVVRIHDQMTVEDLINAAVNQYETMELYRKAIRDEQAKKLAGKEAPCQCQKRRREGDS